MIIQAAKKLKILSVMLVSIMMLVYLFCIFDNVCLFIFIFIITCPLVVLNILKMGKKIVMDEQGCEVRFGRYKRKYLWTELEIKKIEGNWEPSIVDGGEMLCYDKGAYFSKRPIHKAKKCSLYKYAIWHPLFIYVHFSPKKEIKGEHLEIFEIDEDLFMQKMKEWGVELEDCTRKDISK